MIIFSSDEYFEKIYQKLSQNGIEISALVTEKPKPKGRGLLTSENPAHLFANSVGLKVMSDFDFKNEDIGFVFAYGKIIPQKIISAFKFGILNLHPSLLPSYRGATPIQTAILNGDELTGYSIIKISEKMDEGDILHQEEIEISEDDGYISLRKKIISQAIEKLPEIINDYLSGQIEPNPQVNSAATYCKKFSKQDGEIANDISAGVALRKIRAFESWPKTFFYLEEKRAIIHEAHLESNQLAIDKIQLEGKNVISFDDFKRGYPNLLTKLPPFVKID